MLKMVLNIVQILKRSKKNQNRFKKNLDKNK